MGFYSDYIEPALVSCACGVKPIRKQREKIAPRAHGTVLEVGFGSGHNLPFYDSGKIKKLYALEPSKGMRKRAAKRLAETEIDIELIDLPGEKIPLAERSVDSILITYTLCTIPDAAAALAEMRRVLRPGGEIFFCEHGRAPDAGPARMQDRLNGFWKSFAGGCNLNRDIPALFRDNGFALADLETKYLPRAPKFVGFNYWGAAVAA